MAIQNTANIYINGINVTAFTVLPLKWGDFLDEQLDEMYLSLRHCPFDNFKPLTPVEIQYTNTLSFQGQVVNTETVTKRYIVADDKDVEESPVGGIKKGTTVTKLYNHNLYIIEITKYLECIIVDTNTITNSILESFYTNNPIPIIPTVIQATSTSKKELYGEDADFIVLNSSCVSPLLVGTSFTCPTMNQIYDQDKAPGGAAIDTIGLGINNTIKAYYEGNLIQTVDDIDQSITISSLQEGSYSFVYNFQVVSVPGYGGWVYTITLNFAAITNQYPLKKWTITDVINKLCDIAEPLSQGDTPRFKLNATQAALYENVLAPQFSFTKSTFRECLQECGKIVHGEPRIDIATDTDDSFYFEISFDEYAGTELSNISSKPYIDKSTSQGVENYASQLDSTVENLVNQLNKYAGVIVEPYSGGYKTVRTETVYARIEDGNMIISTQYPIDSVEKLESGYIPENTDLGTDFDLTKYVFESSIYKARLSSYSAVYPYSKAYALTYTQGEKNITGLNFKVENPIPSIFENYAILNILGDVTGEGQSLTINNANGTSYPQLAFRVTYTPFYNSRVGQTKLNYQDYTYPASLIYNQQSNIIEAQYYGENLKGAIARIGNVEKSYTYILARLSEIPKAGQLFDKDYYITAVSVEYLAEYIKCTIGLSKDFNRLSQYIGISSVKRYSEVSQGQALERNTLWKEYVVVGNQITATNECVGANMLLSIMNTFNQSTASQFAPLTNVNAWGLTAGGNVLPAVNLPLISSAFGNSIAFSWEYEDNYSAGAISTYQTNGATENEVSGYFQDNYRYTDYYGRIYYYHFDLQQAGTPVTSPETQTQIGTSLPAGTPTTTNSGFISTVGGNPKLLRKDNREKLQCNYQIDFVTNSDIIIGSALASYCSAVRPPNSSYAAKLYVFAEPLNKFIDHVSGSLNVDLETMTGYPINVIKVNDYQFYVEPTGGVFPNYGKSWAICTQQTTVSIDVEGDDGTPVTQTEQEGGDLLIGQNIEFTTGQDFPPVYFTFQKEIFDRSCWVANK